MEQNNEGNTINAFQEVLASVKRIEFLLEEVIFQQIIPRTKDIEEANEKFKLALGNVAVNMKDYAQRISGIDSNPSKD